MQQSLRCGIRLPECSSSESHPMQTIQSLFLRIAQGHQKRWFQANEVAAIYDAKFSGTLASGGPCLTIVILRGIQDDLGRTLLLTKFLPYVSRVPKIIADLFWLSTQGIVLKSVYGHEFRVTVFNTARARLAENGTVEVLSTSDQVCPVRWTQRAVGWLQLRELFSSDERWGETRKRSVVHFTLIFLRFPEYVHGVGTFSKRPTQLGWPSRHWSGEFGQRDRDHQWFHSTRLGEVTKFVRLTVGPAVSNSDRSRN